jgi:hypothetical protein
MILDLSDEETTALLRELDGIIDGDKYFLSPRVRTLREILNMIRPEPIREPLLPPRRADTSGGEGGGYGRHSSL